MFPLIGPALEFAGGLAADIFGANSAQQQMQFQEQMSNTAYQRGTQDMEKAGINPMLAAGGSSASTPTGTMFTPSNPAQGATQSLLAGKQSDLMDAQISSASEQASAYHQQAVLSSQQSSLAMIEKNLKLTPEVFKALGQNYINQAKLSSAQVQSEISRRTGQDNQNAVSRALADYYDTPAGKLILPLIQPAQGIRSLLP